MAKYVDSPDLYIKKGKKGRIWANVGRFRAFLFVAIYLPVSPLDTLKTAYFRQKRNVPIFNIL